MSEDTIRRILRAAVESQRLLLAQHAKMISAESELAGLNEELRETYGAELPPDIDAMLTEITKLRRTRYMQYLRAILDDFSSEM